uniref:Putative nitric oxide reductase FlRd-NAD(+) reductase n=1 Tax=termite gut metagenome TaxID=433724 RepID=S0DF36_9ZZZZ
MSGNESNHTQQPVVIVGTGLAGYTVARELRKLDSTVPLILLSQDDGSFYSKPMLSNALAMKKEARALASFDSAAMAQQLNAEVRTHQRVERIVPGEHTVVAQGEPLRYSKLVLATGADPRRLRIDGDGAEQILSVNDLADYDRFRQALAGCESVAILGAGLIGCEFANDLCAAGYAVSLIDPAGSALARLLPERAGAVFEKALSERGVRFYIGRGVAAVDHAQSGYRLTLDNGEAILADLVLSAIGLVPRTALASEAGIEVEQGIRTDAWCRTSAEDVFALGDCAAFEGKVQPYVLPIMHAARALARTLNGQATRVEFPVMPVVIKTPAAPAVVVVPEGEGEWRIDAASSDTAHAARAVCHHLHSGRPIGFALVGAATADKAGLLKELAAAAS